jgi:hypothetical protein
MVPPMVLLVAANSTAIALTSADVRRFIVWFRVVAFRSATRRLLFWPEHRNIYFFSINSLTSGASSALVSPTA